MNLGDYIKNRPIVVYSTIAILSFVAGVGVMKFIFKESGLYISIYEVNEKYILKSDVKPTYIIGKEELPEDRKKDFLSKTNEVVKIVPIANLKYDELNDEKKFLVTTSQMDVIAGQLEIVKKIFSKQDIVAINDSLYYSFQNKYKEYEKLKTKLSNN